MSNQVVEIKNNKYVHVWRVKLWINGGEFVNKETHLFEGMAAAQKFVSSRSYFIKVQIKEVKIKNNNFYKIEYEKLKKKRILRT